MASMCFGASGHLLYRPVSRAFGIPQYSARSHLSDYGAQKLDGISRVDTVRRLPFFINWLEKQEATPIPGPETTACQIQL